MLTWTSYSQAQSLFHHRAWPENIGSTLVKRSQVKKFLIIFNSALPCTLTSFCYFGLPTSMYIEKHYQFIQETLFEIYNFCLKTAYFLCLIIIRLRIFLNSHSQNMFSNLRSKFNSELFFRPKTREEWQWQRDVHQGLQKTWPLSLETYPGKIAQQRY